MKTIFKFSLYLIAPIALVACDFGDDDFSSTVQPKETQGVVVIEPGVTYSSGDLDLTTYVALGDSLTAGYADGALYRDGQIYSFPNNLAQIFQVVGGAATFNQPLTEDNLGGLLVGGVASENLDVRLVLTQNGPARQNKLTTVTQGNEITTSTLPAALYQNLGVPGARSDDLDDPDFGDLTKFLDFTQTPPSLITDQTLRTGSPFYINFAEANNPGNPLSRNTVLTSATSSQTPTFFTLWIGNNDILGYASDGGAPDPDDPTSTANDSATATAYGTTSRDITDPAVFDTKFNNLLTGLLATGAKGVVANMPEITTIPYFTTVPYNAIPLTQEQADDANAAFADYNNAMLAAAAGVSPFPAQLITPEEATQRTINFVAGQNAALILDDNLTDLAALTGNTALLNFRQATAEDYIILPTSSVLGELRDENDATSVIGVGSPLLDHEILTETEAAEVEAARDAYNTSISSAVTVANATSNEVLLFDASAKFADIFANGFDTGNDTLSTDFVSGGIFSLDGIHPTAKGYAVLTNLMIDEINTFFNANLPKTNIDGFTEVFFAFPDGYDFSQ